MFSLSTNLTLFETFKILVNLLYRKFSPVISVPSFVVAFPPSDPIIKFPFSKTLILVTLKVKLSFANVLIDKLKKDYKKFNN